MLKKIALTTALIASFGTAHAYQRKSAAPLLWLILIMGTLQ